MGGREACPRTRVDRNRVVAIFVHQDDGRAVGFTCAAHHKLAVDAFSGPQVQAHLSHVIVANACNQADLNALSGRGNGRITAFAAGQAIEVRGHAGLSALQGLRNAGHQVHVPTGHADHAG